MSNQPQTFARRAVRAVAIVVVATLVLAASPALADVPSGWPEPEPVPLLRALLVYLVAPLGLVLLIALLTVAPSLARGERPSVGTPDDQWFGGPRSGTRELGPGTESGTESTESGTTTTGGASGGW